MSKKKIAVGSTFQITLPESVDTDSIAINVEQDYVIITRDKLERIFDRARTNRFMTSEWTWFCGLSFSLLMTLLTSTFNDFVGGPAIVYKRLFQLAMVISLALALVCLARKCWKYKLLTEDWLWGELKGK